MRNEPEKKRCTQCRAIKPLSEFGSRPERLDGHAAQCKACLAERASFEAWRRRVQHLRNDQIMDKIYALRRLLGLYRDELKARAAPVMRAAR